MILTELFNTEIVTISCELFPPKQGAQLDNYKMIVGYMAALIPAYMSVTYGSTGGTSDYTVELANEVRNVNHIPALAHLTCASSTKEKVASVIQELKEKQIENVLALRGDIPQNADFPLPNQYKHASELIYDIKSQGDFCIGGACYPEGHPESQTLEEDLIHLKEKLGITFVYVTHDQEEALTMSDKIVVMNAGEIQQIGTPTEIYRTPVNEFVAKFIGETNIIDGVMLEDDLVMFEDKKYACRARGYNKNEKVDVVIRPEHLDIVPRAEGMLKGTVKSQLFKGMHYETVVETRVGTSITVKMQVSQYRPVFYEDKREKISAIAFLLDVEDVEELDDAKVVALASAEAWDAETEEPISIKTVEYDIKPETGNYTVTFATANDTSITVKVLVVAQNRVESKVYQDEIYAMNFFKKVEDIQESIALDTDLETWASASAWSLEDGEQVEITDVKYDFDPETITPGVYDVTFSTEGYEYKVSTTHAFEEGEQGGLVKAESALYASKVQLVCPKCGAATRVGHTKVENKNGKTVSMRVCKKCGAQFE